MGKKVQIAGERINGVMRLTRLEAQTLFVQDHQDAGAIITEPLSIEPDEKPEQGYYLRTGYLKLVRLPKDNHFDRPYALVSAKS